MNTWFANIASQHQQKGLSRSFVAVDISSPADVLGYYSLASTEVSVDDLQKKKDVSLPRIIPAVRLGKLAVDVSLQGKGLGELLLVHALDNVKSIASHMGVHAVVVDALDEKAAAFYEKYGFVRSPQDPLMLALPVASIP